MDGSGPQDGHGHAGRAREESAHPSYPLEVNSNLIMIAFMIGSAALLALVSLWVLGRFSPQTLKLGLRSPQTTAAAPAPNPTAQPTPILTPTPTPTPTSPPIAVPSSVPPSLWTRSEPARSPSPVRTTVLATAIVDMALPATDPVSAATATGTASPIVTPAAPAAPTVPGAPTNVTATAGNRSATITWSAPSDGGSAITRYTITPYIGTTAQTPTVISGGPPAPSATVTGLKNGTTYTFTVTATNAVGTGPPSAQSNPVTPPH
jgi:hypothetical protein